MRENGNLRPQPGPSAPSPDHPPSARTIPPPAGPSALSRTIRPQPRSAQLLVGQPGHVRPGHEFRPQLGTGPTFRRSRRNVGPLGTSDRFPSRMARKKSPLVQEPSPVSSWGVRFKAVGPCDGRVTPPAPVRPWRRLPMPRTRASGRLPQASRGEDGTQTSTDVLVARRCAVFPPLRYHILRSVCPSHASLVSLCTAEVHNPTSQGKRTPTFAVCIP